MPKNILLSLKEKILNQPLILNMLSVGLVTLLIKVVSFYKEIVVAASFGLSELIDTFLIATLIPSFIQNVFINALRNLFIPNYITELNTTKDKGGFQVLILCIITVIISVLTIITFLFTNSFLETIFPGHTESYYDLIKIQLYFILPCLFFWSISSYLGALLEIEGKFFYSTFSSIFLAITTIIALFFFKEQLGDTVLAVGLLSGSFLAFLYLLILCLYYKCIKLSIPKLNNNMRTMIRQLPPKVTSGLLTGVNPFVDQFFAAQLAVGSIASMNYGTKIPSFIVGILIIALGNVLLPYFSKLVNENINKAYHHLFRILKIIFFASSVITLIAIFFSHEIISILFERKEFTAKDTIVVSDIQKIVLIYVPFYLSTLILVKFLTSINKNSFMAWVSFLNLIVNLILNIIFVKIYGVYGLVLSTTLVYIISSLFYLTYTYKQYKNSLTIS